MSEQQQKPQSSDKAIVITAIKTLDHAVTVQRSAFQKALPSGFQLDQIISLAKSVIKSTPALAKCELGSLVGAVMKATQYGLALGELGQAYIVPFWSSKLSCNEAQLIIGYRGYMELARRSGSVKKISARVVYSNDQFNVSYGASETITHLPCLQDDRGEAKFVYAIATLQNDEHIFEVIPISECEKLRDQQTAKIKFNKDESPWMKHFDEMARKTAVRRLFKYLPVEINKTPIVNEMLAFDNSSNLADIEPEKLIEIEPIIPPQSEVEAKLDVAKDTEKTEIIEQLCKRVKLVNRREISNTALSSLCVTDFKVESLEKVPIEKLATTLKFLNEAKLASEVTTTMQ